MLDFFVCQRGCFVGCLPRSVCGRAGLFRRSGDGRNELGLYVWLLGLGEPGLDGWLKGLSGRIVFLALARKQARLLLDGVGAPVSGGHAVAMLSTARTRGCGREGIPGMHA